MKTTDVWAHRLFCHPKLVHFLKANISLNITQKELILSVIINFDTLLNLPSLICIFNN